MFNLKKIAFINLLLIYLFLLHSCKEDEILNDNLDEETQIDTLEIFPLKLGNSWTYKLNVYPKDDSVDTYRETTLKVVTNTTFDEKKYFNIQVDGNLESNLYINQGDGHYFFNSKLSPNNDILAFKYPCQVGDSWERMENQFVYGNKSFSVVNSLNTKISVPYGEFECIEYINEKSTFFSSKDTLYILEKSYLKPGLGPVNLSTYHKINYNGIYTIYSSLKLVNATIK